MRLSQEQSEYAKSHLNAAVLCFEPKELENATTLDEFMKLATQLANDRVADITPGTETFENESWLKSLWKMMTWIAGVWALLSVSFLWLRRFSWMGSHEKTADFQRAYPYAAFWLEVAAAVIVTSWAIGPPAWFAYEAMKISEIDKDTKRKRMARWKLGSGAARAFWIGIGTLVAGLYIKWEFGG